jgi:hypothetical protein
MTDGGGQHGDSKSQRYPPSYGLAPVNRREIPMPIGALSYWFNSQWREDFRALIQGH